MAKASVAREQFQSEPQPRTIRVKIDGLIPNHDGTFDLENVVIREVNYMEVEAVLVKSGIELFDAQHYVESFADTVLRGELAKTFAARTTYES